MRDHAETLEGMTAPIYLLPPECIAACAAGAEAIRENAKLRRQLEEMLLGDTACNEGCHL